MACMQSVTVSIEKKLRVSSEYFLMFFRPFVDRSSAWKIFYRITDPTFWGEKLKPVIHTASRMSASFISHYWASVFDGGAEISAPSRYNIQDPVDHVARINSRHWLVKLSHFTCADSICLRFKSWYTKQIKLISDSSILSTAYLGLCIYSMCLRSSSKFLARFWLQGQIL